MAIIELNLEKPALKRVESGEKQQSKSSSRGRSSSQKTDEGGQSGQQSKKSSEKSSGQQSGSQSKSRIRKYGRRIAILGGTAAGAAAVRKYRQRQKSGSKGIEEDWQTAETSPPSTGSESSSSGSQ